MSFEWLLYSKLRTHSSKLIPRAVDKTRMASRECPTFMALKNTTLGIALKSDQEYPRPGNKGIGSGGYSRNEVRRPVYDWHVAMQMHKKGQQFGFPETAEFFTEYGESAAEHLHVANARHKLYDRTAEPVPNDVARMVD